MRNLHTIKGNSRIFGFSSISTAVHQAEAKVLEAKERGTNELSIARAEIRASLNSVHKVLDQYGEVAYRVFGIGNPFVFKPNEANGSEFHSGAGTVALEISQDKIKSLKSLVAEAENGKASLAEIKRAVSRLSETPVGPAFSKFQAMVKEVSGNLGKSAQLIIIDDGVELDREVVNQLRDVLTHLLRNAIDHGLEIIEKRKSSGKSEMGTIRIHCREEGGDVIVKLEDDGKGIDGDEIARAAVRKGLRTDTEIQKLSQEEKIDLIFLPGLSSKEIVTEISGRGVGMDFVKDAIAQMSAQISIDTKVGRGTNFTIRFKRERLGVIHA
jgi:chemotaxis protein histidine kinase CheA